MAMAILESPIEMAGSNKSRDHVAKTMIVIASLMAYGMMALAHFLNLQGLLIPTATVAIFGLLAYALIASGKGRTGRFVFVTGGVVAFTMTYAMLEVPGNIHFLYAICITSAFALFSSRKDRKVIMALLAMIAAGWAAEQQVAQYLPKVQPTPEISELITNLLVGIVIVYLAIQQVVASQSMNESIRNIEDQKDDAIRANAAKSDFLSKMSREIRTSMNAVLGSIQILERTDLTMQQQRLLHTVSKSGDGLLRVIEDILDSFRVVQGDVNVSQKHIDLLSEFEIAVEMMRMIADEKGVRLRVSYDPDLPDVVLSDATRLRQILTNVAGNALAFSGADVNHKAEEPVVYVEMQRAGSDHLRIITSDNGVGMSADKIEKLYSTKIGLVERASSKGGEQVSFTRKLVELMNGTIHVESQVGEGTRVTIDLPLDVRHQRIDRIDLSEVHVLSLVDELDFEKKVRRYLEGRGATVETFGQVESALDRVKDYPDKFLILYRDSDDENEVHDLEMLRKYAPHTPLIRLSNARDASFLKQRDNEYIVSASPMLPTTLWHAVATMSGRLQGVVIPDNAPHLKLLPSDKAPKHKGTVLVAEDNLINQQVLSQMLTSLGYTVVVASNGLDGLQKWQNTNFDFVLADCQMPKMDGYEMTRQIRKYERTIDREPVRIIGVTADASDEARERCQSAGMDDFLAKPIVMETLEKELSNEAA